MGEHLASKPVAPVSGMNAVMPPAGEQPVVGSDSEVAGKRLLILGGGSNILVSDSGFAGLVIRMSSRGITPLADEVGIITVQAGEEWDPFVRWCVDRNLAGIECLSGIPGTVGGTPVQNVGAYGQEVREVVLSVRVLDLHLHEHHSGCASCRYQTRKQRQRRHKGRG